MKIPISNEYQRQRQRRSRHRLSHRLRSSRHRRPRRSRRYLKPPTLNPLTPSNSPLSGLFILPPSKDDSFANWSSSTAGHKEDDPNWLYVPPVPNTFTVFPGDMLQYLANSALPSTPHKVGLNTRERFAFAYFHEPNFRAVLRPLPGYDAGQEPREGIHYGTHFTNMFLRNYPDRVTTKRMEEEGRYEKLTTSELRDE